VLREEPSPKKPSLVRLTLERLFDIMLSNLASDELTVAVRSTPSGRSANFRQRSDRCIIISAPTPRLAKPHRIAVHDRLAQTPPALACPGTRERTRLL
jgi:hypothetical protein